MKLYSFRRLRLLAILSAISFLAANANAASRTWTSTATGLGYWQTNTAWSGATAPVATDDLVFNTPITGGTRTTTNDFAANTAFNNITFNANAYILRGNAINLTGNVTNTASAATETIDLNLNLQQNTFFAVNVANGRIDVNGDISGGFGLTKFGPGTVRLQTSTKTYSGDTTVDSGTLDLNVANALPSGVGKGNVSVTSGATLGLRFGLNLNGLSGGGLVSALSSGTKAMSLGNNDANGSFSGVIQNGSGAISLTKVGVGIQTLSGANTYTGTTAVNGGTLLVNGSTAASVTTVGVAGTLGGAGSVGGATTVSGALDPGAAAGTIGTLSFANNLTLNAGSVTTFQLDRLAAQNADLLSIGGQLSLGGTWNVANIGTALLPGDTFDLFNSATLIGSLSLLNLPTLDAGYGWDISLFGTSGVVSVIAVPEPTVAVLGLGGLVLLLGCRRNA